MNLNKKLEKEPHDSSLKGIHDLSLKGDKHRLALIRALTALG